MLLDAVAVVPTRLSPRSSFLQSQSASLGVIAGICQVLLAVWKVLGSCSLLQVEAVLQNVLLRLADGEGHAGQGIVRMGGCVGGRAGGAPKCSLGRAVSISLDAPLHWQ